MPGRARYDGPYTEINIFDPQDPNKKIDTVKRGGLLSADVPAAVRDEMLAREDWTEVKDPSGTSSPKKED